MGLDTNISRKCCATCVSLAVCNWNECTKGSSECGSCCLGYRRWSCTYRLRKTLLSMRYYFNYNRQTGRIPRSVDQVDFPDFMKPLNTLFKEGWNTSVLAH